MNSTKTIDALNERITQRIITAIEQSEGKANWSPPWADGIDVWSPANPITGKRYTAGNRFCLGIIAWMQGYGSHWATFKQWASLSRHTPACEAEGKPSRSSCAKHGCEIVTVRKGEHGTHALRPLTVTDKETGEMTVKGYRPYVVFAAQQVEGYVEPEPTKVEHTEDMAQSLADADEYARIVGVNLQHDPNNGACYIPSYDRVVMPEHDRWTQPDRYWATLIHEMIHWTGHESRLKREFGGQGTEEYAREELVAELGACFHLSHLGRSAIFRDDHVQYLKAWLSILKADPKALWHASTQAERASKLLGARFQARMTADALS